MGDTKAYRFYRRRTETLQKVELSSINKNILLLEEYRPDKGLRPYGFQIVSKTYARTAYRQQRGYIVIVGFFFSYLYAFGLSTRSADRTIITIIA